MKGYLGESKELVLLTIANPAEGAYRVVIINAISERAHRKLSIGALHATPTRLEEKGYLTSFLGEPTEERGGRSKRHFEITASAKVELAYMKSLRGELWAGAQMNLSLK
ncbi:MAG: PadR family transcriptional regulator [Bacteroidota bacterium]